MCIRDSDRMTQKSTDLRPKIALFEPDIPQNTAAIIRTCACLGAKSEIIEPKPKIPNNIKIISDKVQKSAIGRTCCLSRP